MNKKYLFYISQNYSYAILRPLQAAALARGDTVAWYLEGDQVNASYLKKEEIRLNKIVDVIDYCADACFVPGNMIPSFIPGLKVAVFHGFDAGKVNRKGLMDHFTIRGCFDLYCTQGPATTNKFKELAEKYKYFRVVETGWPTLDPLFIDNEKEKKPQPTILMCSTFSRNLTCAPHLYEQVKKLSNSKGWHWIIQFHPKMPLSIVEKYKALQNDNLTFIETDNILPLLKQADVMLCDTSSVLLMFLLQQKPVVTYKNANPEPCLLDFSNEDELEKHLKHALTCPPELMKNIENKSKMIHPYHDGKSSERILDAVENELKNISVKSSRKPLNLIRTMKARHKLNYWKFW